MRIWNVVVMLPTSKLKLNSSPNLGQVCDAEVEFNTLHYHPNQPIFRNFLGLWSCVSLVGCSILVVVLNNLFLQAGKTYSITLSSSWHEPLWRPPTCLGESWSLVSAVLWNNQEQRVLLTAYQEAAIYSLLCEGSLILCLLLCFTPVYKQPHTAGRYLTGHHTTCLFRRKSDLRLPLVTPVISHNDTVRIPSKVKNVTKR